METMIPMYSTKLFSEIYENASDFASDYTTIGLSGISDQTLLNKLFYLLYARFGNSPIANNDETQFKYKLFSVIFMYGPTWEKKLDIQEKIRNLSDADLREGNIAVYNHALNPGEMSAQTTTESWPALTYIDQQNTTKNKKSKVDGYALQWSLLVTDVTNSFLNKFEDLFKKFVRPENTLLYEE